MGFSKTVCEEMYYDWWNTFKVGPTEHVHIQHEDRTVTFVSGDGDSDHVWADHFVVYKGTQFCARRVLRYRLEADPGNGS